MLKINIAPVLTTKTVLAVLLISVSFAGKAQYDPLFNQYQFNQHFFNPGYTGIHNIFQAHALVRSQWSGIDGAPTTTYLGAHTSFADNRNSVGISILNDQIGISNNYEVFGSYSFKIDNQISKISFGIQGGVQAYSYNFNELEVDVTDDPLLQSQAENVTRGNFGFGLFYTRKNLYAGFSIPRLLDLNVTDFDVNGTVIESTRLQRQYYFSAGYLFDRLFAIQFKPHVLVRYVEDGPLVVDLNFDVLLNERIWAGISLRNNSAIGLNGSFIISQSFRAGYSFELPLNNDLVSSQFGTHEIGVSLDLGLFGRQAVASRYF